MGSFVRTCGRSARPCLRGFLVVFSIGVFYGALPPQFPSHRFLLLTIGHKNGAFNWWKQRNQFVSVYTQRLKVGFVFMCSHKGRTDRKWFQKMDG